MKEYLRIAKQPIGMSRLIVNYSRIKEMERRGLSIMDIADIFDQDREELKNFLTVSDGFVSGEKSLTLDIGRKTGEAVSKIAKALT